ncbi:WXG100 family type VII secretion target [Gordonia araii]|nr:WXG100 family type VII secretion target [Gordonia araii]NNG98797.1 WXG100 family type VII secretion target [Gordonia araii NBRC 100433]
MGDNLNVDRSALLHAADRFEEIAEEIRSRVDSLTKESEHLFETWVGGKAVDRFRPGVEDWTISARALTDRLEYIAKNLVGSANAYQNQEDSNTAALRTSTRPTYLNLDV